MYRTESSWFTKVIKYDGIDEELIELGDEDEELELLIEVVELEELLLDELEELDINVELLELRELDELGLELEELDIDVELLELEKLELDELELLKLLELDDENEELELLLEKLEVLLVGKEGLGITYPHPARTSIEVIRKDHFTDF